MTSDRACTLVFSVLCSMLGFSLALHVGDSVAAGLVLVAACLSWAQWTFNGWSEWYYMTKLADDVPAGALLVQLMLFLSALVSYLWALIRIFGAIFF